MHGSSFHARQRSDSSASPFTRLEFERHLRDALDHLHDPGHLQSHPLARLARLEASSSTSGVGRALHAAILEAIESLRPTHDSSASAQARRIYLILRLRYVEALEVPQVLDRLSLSKSYYYVNLKRALGDLAAVLWDQWGLEQPRRTPRRQSDGAAWETHSEAIVRRARTQNVAEPHTNLPVQLTSFVGRGAEVAEVKRLLGAHRLLTLTGSGGCGKTRLALRVAEDLVGDYPDGVWLVDLAALSDAGQVPRAVASALGLTEATGDSLLAALSDRLRARSLLLMLDNCEHLIAVCATLVDALLHACPGLTVLATSRRLLGVPGELAWRVPPLASPDPDRSLPIEALVEYEAIRLFVERATLVRPDFAVTDANAPLVAQICRRLDGMPLAIELAAARTGGLAVDQLAVRLDDRFRLLTGGSRTALPRQQTLRATMDWSYDLLTSEEKVLLHRLAVFVGGWSLEAAEAVCRGEGIEGARVLDLLLGLVDRSLVVAETAREPVRYRLLETVRQYALEHLTTSGEESRVRDRHLIWCVELAERGAPEMVGRDQSAWLKSLELEDDNLRAALAWCLAREGMTDAALRLGLALGAFWQRAQRSEEAREWLGRVLETSTCDVTTRIRLLWLASEAEAHIGNHRKAVEWRREGLELARETGDKRLIALALLHSSYYPFDTGDLTEARRLQEAALELARTTGDARAIWDVLCHLSSTLMLLGDYESMRQVAKEGIALSQALEDWEKVGLLTTHLGYASLAGGDLGRALALGQAGLAQARGVDSVFVEVLALRLLGDVARSQGDFGEAEGKYRAMLEAWRQVTGNRLYATSLLPSVAGLALARGQTERGLRILGAVFGWLEKTGMSIPWGPGPHYQQDESIARTALAEGCFVASWAEGQAMTIEEAVEYALSS